MASPDPPFSLTPADWLVLFPQKHSLKGAAARFPHSFSETELEAGASLDDPASNLRTQYPIDRKTLDETIEGLGASSLAFQHRVWDFLMLVDGSKSSFWWCDPRFLATTISDLSAVATIGVLWKLNEVDGLFGSQQLIGGIIASSLIVVVHLFSLAGATLSVKRSEVDDGAKVIAPMEQLIRWHQATSGKLDSNDGLSSDSRLFEHDSHDELCPCRDCLGGLPDQIARGRWLRSVVVTLSGCLVVFSFGWSACVHYASVFWATWWGWLLGLVFVVTDVLANFSGFAFTWSYIGIPQINMAKRIYYRASSRALRSFLEKAKQDLRAPPQGLSGEPHQELFVKLHFSYMCIWQSDSLGNDLYTVFMFTLLPISLLIGAILNMVRHLCGHRCRWL
jgi:hypothetical protein